MGAWLYILQCADRSYYVGTTRSDLETRLSQHSAGAFGGYTALRLPVALVYSNFFDHIQDAIAAERQVKGWRARRRKRSFAATSCC